MRRIQHSKKFLFRAKFLRFFSVSHTTVLVPLICFSPLDFVLDPAHHPADRGPGPLGQPGFRGRPAAGDDPVPGVGIPAHPRGQQELPNLPLLALSDPQPLQPHLHQI